MSRRRVGQILFSRVSWSIGILSVVVVALFQRVYFKGEHISRLGFLSKVDAFCNPGIQEAIVPLVFDPTSYLGFWPCGYFSFHCWLNKLMPLWNPNLGCGYPHAGDPQCYWFSPLNFIYAYAGTPFSDFVVIAQSLLAALGMLFLARQVGISWLAGIWCGVTFAFCPRVLAVSDLRNNEFLLPWVFLSLLIAGASFSIRRCILAAVTVSFMIVSSHPESSFFNIIFGAFYAFLLVSLTPAYRHKIRQRAVLATISALFVIGSLSFCFSAPVILPFLEFFLHASFYKSITGVSLQSPEAFINGFLRGQGEQACFAGIACLPLLLLSVVGVRLLDFCRMRHGRRWLVPVAVSPVLIEISIAVLMMFMAFPPQFAQGILSLKPICYLAPYYGEPVMLLLLLLAGARGMDILHRCVRRQERYLAALFILFVFLSLLLYAWHTVHLSEPYNVVSLGKAAWHAGRQERWFLLNFLILGFAAVLTLVVSLRWWRPVAFIIVASSVCTSYYVAKESLPSMPAVTAVHNKITEYLQKQDGRITATGSNFFLPNTNLLVNLPDLRCFSPFHPRRYEEFLEAAGAKRHNLFFFSLPDQLNHVIDLSSVKYVVTRKALLNASASLAVEKEGSIPLKISSQGKVAPGVRIVEAQAWFDPYNSEFLIQCRWRLHKMAEERYAIQYFVVPDQTINRTNASLPDLLAKTGSGLSNSSGMSNKMPVWVGRKEFFAVPDAFTHEMEQTVALPVPIAMMSLPQLQSVNLGFVIWDTWTGQRLQMDGRHLSKWQDGAILSQYEPGLTDAEAYRQGLVLTNDARRFMLEFEYDGMRVYRNTRALPPAYLVHEVKIADDAHQSLESILSADVDWTKVAVIEGLSVADKQKQLLRREFDAGADNVKTGTLSLLPFTEESVSIKRPDNNSCIVGVDCKQFGYLILTDTMYPGWCAELDGRAVPILHANYLFRAVAVPPGRHTVVFAYRPAPVAWGLLLFVFGSAWAVFLLLRDEHKRRKH